MGRGPVTKRRVLIAVAGVLALGALAAAVYFGLQYRERTRVQKLVSSYNVALASALYDHRPEALEPYTSDRELTRVANYISSLWGRGVFMEAELLDMDLEQVRSDSPTITVTTRELWKYSERNRETGRVVSPPIEEEQRLVYTLIPEGDKLVVYLSELRESDSAEGAN